MKIKMILATNSDGVIGVVREGVHRLPWKIPEDMTHFRTTTTGHTVVMGRKTHESIGRVLPGRANLVLSRHTQPFNAKLYYEHKASNVINKARILNSIHNYPDDVFIMGGAAIYDEFIDVTDELYLTRVKANPPCALDESYVYLTEKTRTAMENFVVAEVFDSAEHYEILKLVRKGSK